MMLIILKRHLVTRSKLSVRRNQTFFLIKLSALSSVLVRVYWLDNKSSISYSLIMVRVNWLDDKRASGISSGLIAKD